MNEIVLLRIVLLCVAANNTPTAAPDMFTLCTDVFLAKETLTPDRDAFAINPPITEILSEELTNTAIETLKIVFSSKVFLLFPEDMKTPRVELEIVLLKKRLSVADAVN